MLCRPGPTEKYCAEPALKNEFLRDLEQEESVGAIDFENHTESNIRVCIVL